MDLVPFVVLLAAKFSQHHSEKHGVKRMGFVGGALECCHATLRPTGVPTPWVVQRLHGMAAVNSCRASSKKW